MAPLSKIAKIRKHFLSRKSITRNQAEKLGIDSIHLSKIIYALGNEGMEFSRKGKGESVKYVKVEY